MFVKLKIHRRYFFFLSQIDCVNQNYTHKGHPICQWYWANASNCNLQWPIRLWLHTLLPTYSFSSFVFSSFFVSSTVFFYSFRLFPFKCSSFSLLLCLFMLVLKFPFQNCSMFFFFLISEFQFCFWVQLGPLIFRKSPIWSFCPIHQNR